MIDVDSAAMSLGYDWHLNHVAKRKALLEKELVTGFPEPCMITLEIGCGHGHWLVEYASSHPEKTCLGIDLRSHRITRAKRKQSRAGLRNLRFLKGEAIEALEALPGHARITEVFLLFPDPWPKKRHWKNRVFCQEFLSLLSQKTEPNARCHFRTDHAGYFDWALETVLLQDTWVAAESSLWPFETETVFQSKAQSYQSLIIVKQ